MTDLEKEVRLSITDLRGIENKIQTLSAQPNIGLNRNVCTSWIDKTQHATSLENTLACFSVREYAEKWLSNLSAYIKFHLCEPIETMTGYYDTTIPVSIARTLALDAYLAAHWGLYDRLSNVIGRVIGPETIRLNPLGKANPKIVETFFAEKQGIDVLGIRNILVSSYGEQVGFSYLLRNCFVHEGGMLNNVPILSGTILRDAFIMSQAVADSLNAEIVARYKIPNVTISKSGDLFAQLRCCHAIIDNMFVSLLRFMRGTLAVEVEAFSLVTGVTFP